MRYQIISADNQYSLQTQVNEYIKRGFKLQGGVSVVQTELGIRFFYQAIVIEQ